MKRTTWALVLLFLVSLPAVTSRLYASDEIEYYSFLRSLWFDHDVSFDNEYRYFLEHGVARGPGFRETFLDVTTPTGLRPNYGTIGAAILWSPFYLVADGFVTLARVVGVVVARDGYSRPYLAAIAYGSALYGFLAVLVSAVVARRLVGHGELAATLVWLGTPLPFYMYLAPGMAHAPSAFVVAAFVAVWLQVRERWSVRGLAALGAIAALMTMVREQDAFFVSGVALDYLWTLSAEWRSLSGRDVLRRGVALSAGLVAGAVTFIPQAWAYRALNGGFGPARVIADKMRWYTPHAGQVLFSPEHGLFVWTPLALICVAGLVASARERSSQGRGVAANLQVREGCADLKVGSYANPVASYANPVATDANLERALSPRGPLGQARDIRRIAVCLLVMFLAQVYVSGSVGTWTVAGSFGQRRFIGASVLLVVGLASLFRMVAGGQRRMVGALVALSIWWNLGLMVQFGASLMNRQRLEPSRNAYNTFIRVPLEMPVIAYRYFFDRASFYQPVRH